MKYGLIVADPPWPFDDRLNPANGRRRGAESNYPVMTMDEIRTLRVSEVAADDAVLALWIPSSFLVDGLHLDVLLEWGFRPTQLWTWVKTTVNSCTDDEFWRRVDAGRSSDDEGVSLAFGMGWLGRACTEHFVMCVRGKPYKHQQSRSERTAFLHPNLGFSRKPENLQASMERMYPDWPKLELFARRQRAGWTCIGNEAPSSKDVDIRVSIQNLINMEDANGHTSGPEDHSDSPHG